MKQRPGETTAEYELRVAYRWLWIGIVVAALLGVGFGLLLRHWVG